MTSDRLIHLAENKYNRLLTVLFGFLVTMALPQTYVLPKAIGFIICILVMLAVVHQINPGRKLMGLYTVLVFGSLALFIPRLLGALSVPKTDNTQILMQLLVLVMLSLPIFLIQKEIFLTKKVTADALKGAISVYLLMALAWATFYTILYELDPDAFHGISLLHSQADLLHFSFITLTTVGYGNIYPVSAFAKFGADLQAITGVMYPSILIARLVSLYQTNSQETP